MKKILQLALIINVLISINLSLKAQVTIGANIDANQGSLLDLKEYEPDDSNSNSTKGVLLSRVYLTATTGDLATTMGATPFSYDANSHTGLVVYAVNSFGYRQANCPGIYVWNSEEWVALNKPKEAEVIQNKVYDQQGNVYDVATFGTAGVWMTQNLRTTITPCGEPLVESGTSQNYTEKDYYYPNKDKTNYISHSEYGLLYNWAAATNGKGGASGNDFNYDEGEGETVANPVPGNVEEVGVQGICPYGWHIPSDKEWNALEKYITENPEPHTDGTIAAGTWNPSWNFVNTWRGANQGRSLKSQATINGASVGGHSKSSSQNGFDGLAVGGIHFTDGVVNYSLGMHFWTSSAYDNVRAWRRYMGDNSTSNVGRYPLGNRKSFYSVRCKKD